MRQMGIKYTCDRCGLECFVEYRQYYDSGIESHPRDWSYIHGCYLCPDCGRIYRENFRKFIEKE